MSKFEQKDQSGALFRNERKEEGSNQPDYTGNGKVNGQEVAISAWLKTSKGGKKYLSLAFKEPWRGTKVAGDDDVPPGGGGGRGPKPGDFDDTIPFVTNGGDF